MNLRAIENTRARVVMLRFDLSGVGAPAGDIVPQLTETWGTGNRTARNYGHN